MTISHRDATQEAPNKTSAPRKMDVYGGAGPRTFPGGPSDGSVHICPPRKLHCSGCGGTYSSPRHMKGSYHRACKASPAGRFNMPAWRSTPEAP
jgi:hypothetical protein